jgi:dUTP pyrophosphatase
MAEIVNPLNKQINTKEQAIAAAERVIEAQRAETQARRFEFEKFMTALQEVNPELGGFDELSAMLMLPEENFRILAPIFLSELEKGMKNVNDQMIMVQSMNLLGMKAENVREQYEQIYVEIDEQMGAVLSSQKRDFLKQMLGITYNALAEAEGVAKKTILIPIEYCNENAKMPAYAHLTDSGMDVYALEDITIAPGETKLVPTGLKVAIPAGYELQVRPKSGRCLKTKLRIANTPGTIDAGYRDEIGVIVDNIEPFIKSAQMDEAGRLYNVEFGSSYTIGKGEKFAQLVLCEVPKAAFYQVESVSAIENDGRAGGFGSTGVK